MIDFRSRETHLLLNPRMPAEERAQLEELSRAASLEGHVWIATSGTTGALKLTALSKDALLASAAAVNRHLEATADDAWCCVLPTFHVGGLGIHARALLAGSRVVSIDWEARHFADVCAAESIAFSALVPAQVSDLVRERLAAPRSLRAIVVGGGALADALFDEARALGWPLLRSYGMTECGSQVATASYGSDDLQVLSHLEVRTVDDGRLAIRGASLLTGYALFEGGVARFVDPKVDGWFVSEDLGAVEGRVLRVEGRRGEFVKIGGESVDLKRLDRILDEVLRTTGGDAAVFAVPDERLGFVIHLAATRDGVAEAFAARVLPFELPRAVHRVDGIPRSPLGKLLRARLAAELR
ncbi:MAG TPA: AMP-binding protein [Thermoanaerobaculia bacterium]|nr:AMP-binding protein [Thermoanaerobaculia bacterium]